MSAWTKDKPTLVYPWGTRGPQVETLGEWWLSIAPENRTETLGPVIKCDIFALKRASDGYDLFVSLGRPMNWVSIDSHLFAGAQWKRVDPDPADPFAAQPPNNSCDSDFP